MRKEYDFSKSAKNPYTKQLKRQITIRLDAAAVDYFKELAAEMGMPYQNLINLYLRDCAARKSRPTFAMPAPSAKVGRTSPSAADLQVRPSQPGHRS
jgi:hypothetical protein